MGSSGVSMNVSVMGGRLSVEQVDGWSREVPRVAEAAAGRPTIVPEATARGRRFQPIGDDAPHRPPLTPRGERAA
ncbi:hypothetical protein GCM10022215_26410 [Nocardioides fonticola]|uniref:Uncharacterized protein n=1 Tax=Nocardioides fonticola TaxID=450363 RepID=A0ABP7XM76_9ACTN